MIRPTVNLQGLQNRLINVVLRNRTHWHRRTRRSESLDKSCNLICRVQQTIQILLVDTAFYISFPFSSSSSQCCGCLYYVCFNLVMQYCMVMGIIWTRYLYCRMHTSPVLYVSCWHSSLLNVCMYIRNTTLCIKAEIKSYCIELPVFSMPFGAHILESVCCGVHTCTFAQVYDMRRFFPIFSSCYCLSVDKEYTQPQYSKARPPLLSPGSVRLERSEVKWHVGSSGILCVVVTGARHTRSQWSYNGLDLSTTEVSITTEKCVDCRQEECIREAERKAGLNSTHPPMAIVGKWETPCFGVAPSTISQMTFVRVASAALGDSGNYTVNYFEQHGTRDFCHSYNVTVGEQAALVSIHMLSF